MDRLKESEKVEYNENEVLKLENSPPPPQMPLWDDPRVKGIKRKVDRRLALILALMYVRLLYIRNTTYTLSAFYRYAVNQIDRNNLGIA